MSPEGEHIDGGDHTFGYSPDEPNQPALTIIDAISEVTGVDPVDLDPLSDAIDFDAVNALFGRHSVRGMLKRSADESELSDLQVVFEYAGCVVSVTDDRISVSER